MVTWKQGLKLAFLVVCLVWLGSIVIDLVHLQSYRRERQRLDACNFYVRQVAIALSRYRYDHNNQLPQSIESLKASYGSGGDKIFTPPTGEQYIYHFRIHSADNDIVFWDAQVHHVHGGCGCKVRNGDFRPVAYACGREKEMPERDFARLHLDELPR